MTIYFIPMKYIVKVFKLRWLYWLISFIISKRGGPMTNSIEKKKKILSAMFDIYIKKHQEEKENICSLRDYAFQRIEKCPNNGKKIYCSSCTIHCFADNERAYIKKVMRFSGPRMMVYHPLMALDHAFSSIRG